MEVKSIENESQDWCLIQYNVKTGKLYGIVESGKSTENIVEGYKYNWASSYPVVIAKVPMKHDDLALAVINSEKTGGNYFVNSSLLKTTNIPGDYESIFTSAEIRCDYTAQFYRNGEAWPVVDRVVVSRSDTIEICIKSEQAFTGNFTYFFRAKPDGVQDIELGGGIAGSLVDGVLIAQIDLSKINFSHYQDVELKIEHPDSGNSYLYFKVV